MADRRIAYPDGRRFTGERRKKLLLREHWKVLSHARLLSARVQQVSMDPELVALAQALDKALDNLMELE